MRRLMLIACVASVAFVTASVAEPLLVGEQVARAQTTSARSQSLSTSNRADELRAKGAHKRAVRLYRRALEVDPRNERAYLGLSATFVALSKYREALSLLAGAQARLGWTTGIGLQRGLHLSKLRRWHDAIAALERVLKAAPSSFEAAHYLAAANLEAARWPAAVAAFDTYLAHRPHRLAAQDTQIRTLQALALLHSGEHRRARRALEALLAHAPDDLSARMLLFTALARDGACGRALRLLDQLGAAIPRAPTLRYNAAVCHFRRGDGPTALAILSAMRQTQTPPAEAHLLTARIHLSLGDRGRATTAYYQAIAAGLPVELELANSLASTGNYREVVSLLEPRVKAGSRDPVLLALATKAFLATEDLERAALASKYLVQVDSSAASWRLHGDVHLRRKQWVDAGRAYERALQEAPKDPRAAMGLRHALEQEASVKFHAGELASARPLLLRAVELDPSAHDAIHNLALLELASGDAKGCIARLTASAAKSTPSKSQLLLARALLALGNNSGAARVLERLVRGKKTSQAVRAQALSSLAQVIARSSPSRAVRLIARARRIGSLPEAARTALDLAEASARLALAERAYQRREFRQLRSALRGIDRERLAPSALVRLRILQLFARGDAKGLGRALRMLAAISNKELASAKNRRLDTAGLRGALALSLGVQFIREPADYERLRRPVATLAKRARKGNTWARDLLAASFDELLEWAMDRGSSALARTLASAAPESARTPSFLHNAIVVSAARKSGHRRFTGSQLSQLEKLAPQVLEARINLAIDAEARGQHAAALRHLRSIPPARRDRRVAQWLRWKELVHGTR